MTSEEIENERVEKLRKINEVRENLNTVCKEIHALEIKLDELRETKRLARHTLAILKTDSEILQSEFWRAKS